MVSSGQVVAEPLVLETAALLDLLLGGPEGDAVRTALRGRDVHISDHVPVEVAVALQRLAAWGRLSQAQLARRVSLLAQMPCSHHAASELLGGAVARAGLRLGDALSVELSDRLAAPLVTTDSRLATAWNHCWLVAAAPTPGSLA
ncbi:MAG: type II toxin-antitoxin system VapC family toxin [Candidatus Dormibacteria bacterium]|jgi:predicted nucleic acid-binding protein